MAHHLRDGLSQRALEEALQAAFPIVRARLTRRFGDPQLAEEVSWDCLTQAYEVWQADRSYFLNKDLTSWASQRAYWRTVDRLRERGRFHRLSEEHSHEEGEGICPPLVDPSADEQSRHRLHTRQLVWRTLQQLDQLERQILESYYYDDQTDQEIGERLYGKQGSDQARGLRIWRRRRKAHLRLKMLLEENGIDPAEHGGVPSQAL